MVVEHAHGVVEEYGVEYHGEFKDGQFHGPGTLVFPGRGRYTAHWELGKAVDGRYTFSDGLEYRNADWTYCNGSTDRRFFTEHAAGIAPAGRTAVRNDASRRVPRGTLDTGDGHAAP